MPTQPKSDQVIVRNVGFASLRPANRLVEALDRVSGNLPFKVPSYLIDGGEHEVVTFQTCGQTFKRAAAPSVVPSADFNQDIDPDAEFYSPGLSKRVLA